MTLQLQGEQVAITRCGVCGSTGEAQVLLDGLLRRCSSCTFVWTAAAIPPSEELYDGSYFEGEGGGYADYYDAGARRFESRLRLRWLLSSGRPSTLVEVGSAAGFFVAAAREAGIDASGFEISEAAATYARDYLDVPVHQGNFEHARLEEPVDVVCAFHVFEHVADPVAFLGAARNALVSGGRLALEVPNIASAGAQRLAASWPGIQPTYHRWHFNPASLRRMLSRNGFTVVQQDTVFSRFYWRRFARLRHARELVIADWAACGSTRVRHPTRGDILRVVARPTDSEGGR